MFRFKVFYFTWCLLMAGWLQAKQPAPQGNLQAEGYSIASHEDPLSREWGDFLYQNLRSRSLDPEKVKRSSSGDHPGFLHIHLQIAPEMQQDYCFEHTGRRLNIQIKTESLAGLISFQLIERIGRTHDNFQVSELPPAFLDFKDSCREVTFDYREPHLQPNMNYEYSQMLGTHHLERDWGLWGHNLGKILPSDKEFHARVEGQILPEQYCFSSPGLFSTLREYIIDQFGYGQEWSQRLMIAPNDNDVVCLCDRCRDLGNSPGNATPAVGYLLNNLAGEFPGHQFYTLAYRSSKTPPTSRWAENTGVFFTTIDLPKGIPLERSGVLQIWRKSLEQWKEQVHNIYLWDYISNFDDYLTPLPVLYGFQGQLETFEKAGVKGLFLNGSGYDYSPFEDVKTYVLAALMFDRELQVEALIRRYLEKMYPRSHALLSRYYLTLERDFFRSGRPYPMYGGFLEATQTYFDPKKFQVFYKELEQLASTTDGPEQQRLHKLLTALGYTQLQILYHAPQATTPAADLVEMAPPYLKRLANHRNYPDLMRYKETAGQLSQYLRQWEAFLGRSMERDRLPLQKVVFESPADPAYQNSSLLHDGREGFAMDYHQGWVINSGGLWKLAIEGNRIWEAGQFQMRFMNQPRHRILPPEKIEIYRSGELLYRLIPLPQNMEDGVYVAQTALQVPQGTTRLEVRIFKNSQHPHVTTATDEISLFKQKR